MNVNVYFFLQILQFSKVNATSEESLVAFMLFDRVISETFYKLSRIL